MNPVGAVNCFPAPVEEETTGKLEEMLHQGLVDLVVDYTIPHLEKLFVISQCTMTPRFLRIGEF